METLLSDPSTEVRPDFAGDLYAGIRNDLMAATGNCLAETWDTDHEEHEADALAAEEAERALRTQRDEERAQREAEAEREHLEAEKKKPKMNGFDQSTSFVELWYFSPDGCKEALKTSRIDNQLTVSSKAALADHELSFSTFLRAKNLYLVQISKAKWPQTHIDTLSLFFWHLENHTIHNNSEISDLVILNYASRVRQDWHDKLKQNEGFNIASINENLICAINEELWDKIHSQALIVVGPSM
ncbi:hypothetical protein P692DRAFT_201842456 [Suillus brevipes Sb2]|nr:hypothetical protein P692DRAFT_201842456 [Suillus brevipes Sb2]